MQNKPFVSDTKNQTLFIYCKEGITFEQQPVEYETYARLIDCWDFRKSIFGVFASNIFTLHTEISVIDIDLDSIVAVRYGKL